MEQGDVLGPALECRFLRALEPFEGVPVGFDAFDVGEPEALELALLIPIGG